MIRAAFFDIDGTLLSFATHRVSEGTIRAFDKLHRHGVHTFISTGRPLAIVPRMPLSFEGYITMNGALVFTGDPLGAGGRPVAPGNILLRNPIGSDDRDAWVGYATANGICTMLFTESGMYAANINSAAIGIRDQLGFPMPPVVEVGEMGHHQAYQFIGLMPADADAEVAALMPGCRLPRWHPAFTDIVAAGNSKAAGMEAICRHFGIRQEETLAFGDGGNDIEMLQWAGIGVAMGNAEQAVKEAANLVTSSVDDEGIEQAINKILV